MRRRARVWAAAGVLTVVTVGACSHSGGDASSAGGAAARPALDRASAASGDAALSAAAPHDDSGSALPSAKIRTAQMTVAVHGAAHVAARADEAASIAAGAGGELDADDRVGGAHASATMQLRVPPEALTPTLGALSKLGTEKSRRLSTTDVTEKVADVSSRVSSAREAIARLRTLYAHAVKVADVIAIESELSTREADLESLEAQQRALSRETSMAVITLSLVTAPKPKPAAAVTHHRGGFVGGLERGWDGFSAAAAWVATALGTLLPFLVLLALLAVAARLVLVRRHPTPTPSE